MAMLMQESLKDDINDTKMLMLYILCIWYIKILPIFVLCMCHCESILFTL